MGKGKQPQPWRHSKEFISPETYFAEAQVEARSFGELNAAIAAIQDSHGDRLLWRGQADASWGLHSSLFRRLADRQGIALSRQHPDPSMYTDYQHFPNEDDLVEAEARALELARTEWRFDALSSMEILARIQHHGGPTRLLDFSFNPYIAAWFASSDTAMHDVDGRLFALATHGPATAPADPRIMLDAAWGGHELAWHAWKSKEARNANDWGNGSLRRYWIPPAYDNRMLAQNAVFIVEGVPISGMQIQSSFRKRESSLKNDNWRMADLVASGSIYMKMVKPGDTNMSTVRNLASTYTIRLSAEAKVEVRTRLNDLFGYRSSTIFPDIEGLCEYLSETI